LRRLIWRRWYYQLQIYKYRRWNDTITGTARSSGIENFNGTIDTGDGNDIITGTARNGITNSGTINTGNGDDSMISQGEFGNYGGLFLGDGNDSLTADADTDLSPNRFFLNHNAIETGMVTT
jgi:hypothetical protein